MKKNSCISRGGIFLVSFLITLIFMTTVVGSVNAREPYNIKIFTIRAGTSSYIQAVALQEIINKNSEWVKASVVEGKAPGYNLKRVVSAPNFRKSVICHLPGTAHWEALNGLPLFAKMDYDFKKIRYLFPVGFIGNAMLSLDPDITALEDLKGKKLSLAQGRRGIRGRIMHFTP